MRPLPLGPSIRIALPALVGCDPQVEAPAGEGTTGDLAGTHSAGPTRGAGASATGSAPPGPWPATTARADTATDDGATCGRPGDDGDDEPPLDDGGLDFVMTPDVTCAPLLPPGTKVSVGLPCDPSAEN